MGQKGYIPSKRYEDIEEIETKFLNNNNIVGRSDEIQTERESYVISADFANNMTINTISNDMILTSLSVSIATRSTSNSINTVEIYINDGLIFSISSSCQSTGEPQNQIINIPIPNWKLKENEKIKIQTSVTVDGTGKGTATFTGYLS